MDIQGNTAHRQGPADKEFGKLCLASFLFASSVYMLLPVLPLWMADMKDFSQSQMASVMMSFGIGVFLFGAVNSYLIQRYRRNKVCLLAVLAFAACVLFTNYLDRDFLFVSGADGLFISAVVSRFVCGAFFGLAYMVLNSTLAVDCCQSSHRTRANVLSMWAYRVAVAFGPMCGLVVFGEAGFTNTLYVSVAVCLAAFCVLADVKVPFKAPDDTVCFFSCDRFFMPRSLPLFLPAVAAAACLGVFIAGVGQWLPYLFLAAGFALSFLIQKFCASLRAAKWIIHLAYLLVVVGVTLVFFRAGASCWIGSFVLGVGMAALQSRLHVLFIHVGDHCQRGTAQSSFILSFELGVALGVASLVYWGGRISPVCLSLSFAVFSAVSYTVASLSWLKKNLRK